MIGFGSLSNLILPQNCQRKRVSSHDKTGGNSDFLPLQPGETLTLANFEGPGIIKHIWSTILGLGKQRRRNIILRMFWDDEEIPAVEAPIGDFFGIGLGLTRNFQSLPMCRTPRDGNGLNCFFSMPFKKHAKITVTNETEERASVIYFYIDYERYTNIPDEVLYFHAKYRQEYTKGVPFTPQNSEKIDEEIQMGGNNIDGKDNYLILDTEGKGHVVGIVYSAVNLTKTKIKWPGEGDDFIWIDDDKQPSLIGTGTEDLFCTSWSPSEIYDSPYIGIVYDGGKEYTGVSYYRWFIEDPITFNKRIKFSIEHGHANRRSDYISTVVYWYMNKATNSFGDISTPKERYPPQFEAIASVPYKKEEKDKSDENDEKDEVNGN
ncbi:MAG: glycoside hydrolase family 172 protein [Promethearchaeota archaeon]